MQHRIEFVDDDALPHGHDFLLVAFNAGVRIYYRRSAVTPANLEDSWAAYRALREEQRPPGSSMCEPGRHLAVVESHKRPA